MNYIIPYHITALENTRARLIHDEVRTTDPEIRRLVVESFEARGLIVIERQEG